jgi:hypothetical protein
MTKDKATQHWRYERVSATFEKPVDPILKPAVKRKLRSENFVFAKKEEQGSDTNAQNRERAGVEVVRGRPFLHKSCPG